MNKQMLFILLTEEYHLKGGGEYGENLHKMIQKVTEIPPADLELQFIKCYFNYQIEIAQK